MLWTIFVILLVLWLLGLVSSYTLGGFIHILLVIGVIAFAVGGISYTKREKVIDAGPLQVSADKEKTIPLPPVLGGICLVGGIVLVIDDSAPTEISTLSLHDALGSPGQ